MVTDVVLIKDKNAARCDWEVGMIKKVKVSDDGLVRSAEIRMASKVLDAKGRNHKSKRCLERPIQELVVLLSSDTKVMEQAVSH